MEPRYPVDNPLLDWMNLKETAGEVEEIVRNIAEERDFLNPGTKVTYLIWNKKNMDLFLENLERRLSPKINNDFAMRLFKPIRGSIKLHLELYLSEPNGELILISKDRKLIKPEIYNQVFDSLESLDFRVLAYTLNPKKEYDLLGISSPILCQL